MLAPFRWATEEAVNHQSDMVALGRPGIGEAFLADRGFDVAERFEISFVLEFADAETSTAWVWPRRDRDTRRSRASAKPSSVLRATDLAAGHVREGVPLRGLIQLFGYVGTKR